MTSEHPAHRSNRAGFTILELMIVVMLASILVMLVAPALGNTGNRLERRGASDQLVSSLQGARLQAIRTNRAVTLRRLADNAYVVGGTDTTRLEGVTFTSSSSDSVRFAAFGPVLTGVATFRLVAGNETTAVSVSAAGYPSLTE